MLVLKIRREVRQGGRSLAQYLVPQSVYKDIGARRLGGLRLDHRRFTAARSDRGEAVVSIDELALEHLSEATITKPSRGDEVFVSATRHRLERWKVIKSLEHLIDIGEVFFERYVMRVGLDDSRISASEEDHRRPHDRILEYAGRYLADVEFLFDWFGVYPELVICNWSSELDLQFAVLPVERAVEIEYV